MATPDQGRKRIWRFRLNDTATLEVSAADGPTEKQVRRRGRWSLILGTLIAALMVSAVAFASVSTDKYTYDYGETVQITGDGMAAGEDVQVDVTYPDGSLAQRNVVSADGSGDFADSFYLAEGMPGGIYGVRAEGLTSGNVFTTEFDPNVAYNSAVTQTGPTPTSVSPGDTLSWSATAACTNASGSNPCVTPPSGYEINLRQFTTSDCSGTATTVSSGTGSNTGTLTFAAPATPGIYYYKAQHPAQSFGAPPNQATWSAANATACNAVTVASTNAAPTVNAGGPYSGAEGSNIAINGALASDPDGDTLTYSWTKNDSGIEDGGSCTLTSASTLSPTLNCNDNGTVTLTLMVDDGHGHTPSAMATVNVSNVLPTVTFDASGGATNPTSVNENADATTGQVTYSYTISDPGTNDTVDAVATSCGANGLKEGSDTFNNTSGSFNCVFPDGDDPPGGTDTTLSAAASDDDDIAYGTADTLDVNIQNVDPIIQTAAFTMQVFGCGANNVRLDVTFSDPGADSWTATVDWGSGPEAVGAVGKSFSAYHTFNSGGPYTATVVVSDDDLGVSSAFDSTNVAYVGYQSDGILQPINLGSLRSLFKYGSVIPVKLKVKDCEGNLVPDLTLRLRVQMLTSGTPSGVDEGFVSAGSANVGDLFRYDADGGQYIYNLSTKTLTTDPTSGWRLFVDVVLSAGPPEVVQKNMTYADIGLKK